jgi:16S rRNA (guanine527-N7)-methyltransferase
LIAALAERYGLSEIATRQLQILLDCVAEDPAAPTTVTGRPAIVRDHLADSLVALELPGFRATTVLADLGAGAGFPGLALAIALSEARVRLVESSGRKCKFIAATARACELDNVEVVHARAEEWRDGLELCDLVSARALAPPAVVAEYAAPLLRLGGRLVAWRGRIDQHEQARLRAAAAELGLEADDPIRVHPYDGAVNRHLQVMRKTGPTPRRFPRRPGVARKRPLGGV